MSEELPPNSEMVQTTDGKYKLFVKEWKPEGDPKCAITFVHGLGEHCLRYEHVFSQFAENGIHVTAFDHRGHGRSEGSRGCGGSFKSLYQDVALVWERSPKDIPHFLYGHSMGGGIALGYASQQEPETGGIAGVVVTGPMVRPGTPPPGVKVFFGKLASGLMPNMTVDNELDVNGISRDAAEVKKYQDDPLVHGKIGLKLANDLLANGEELLKAGAARFKHPLLLIHGTADRLTSAKASEEFFQQVASVDKQLELLDGWYHEVHNEPEKEQAINTIQGWILDRA